MRRFLDKEAAARAFVLYSRLLLGVLFALSATGKWVDMALFSATIVDYRLLPASWAQPAAVGMVWLETACALALLFGIGLRWAGGLSAGLFVLFTSAVGINLWRGNLIDCGCLDMPLFGPSTIGWHTILRNCFFLAVSCLLFHLSTPPAAKSNS